MEVGSLVECIDSYNILVAKHLSRGEVYVIREIIRDSRNGDLGVLLEEIYNKIQKKTNMEHGYRIGRFKELLPPIDLQKALSNEKHSIHSLLKLKKL